MMLSIIVACGENRVIGVNNTLPWRLPEDLQHFKKITMGKPMIMGRKTFDSIGRPLPGRTTLVVTRNARWRRKGVITCGSVEQALQRACEYLSPDQQEIMVVGGEEIYRQCLPEARRIYLTRVAMVVDGDAFFPELDCNQWREIETEQGCSAETGVHYIFMTLEKI